MKVLHLCTLPLPESHPDHGRIQMHPGKWVLHLAQAQQAHGKINPRLLVQVPGASRDHHAVVGGIPVHFIAAPNRFRSSTLFCLDVRRIQRWIHQLETDLVHAHGTEDAHGLAAQASGLPYVITAQGIHRFLNAITRPSLVSRERMVELAEKICLRRAGHVIAKSRHIRDRLAYLFPHLELAEIPNTTDPGLWDIVSSPIKNTLLFVGTFSPWKGFHLLREVVPEVLTKIPDLQLHVAGDRSPSLGSYEEDEKQAIREIMGKRVVFHGTLPHRETVQLMARSAVLVAPSLEDMFGNQVIESLLVGTPAVVLDGTALAESVQRFGYGWVVPRNHPEKLASAIHSALAAPLPGKETARQKILREMDPVRVASMHHQLYLDILSERGK